MNPWVYSFAGCCFGPLSHSTMLREAYALLRADDEIRTRDPNLGKVVLYQLSHIRVVLFRELEYSNRKIRLKQTEISSCRELLVFPGPAWVSSRVSNLTVLHQVNTGNLIGAGDSETNGLLNDPTDDV